MNVDLSTRYLGLRLSSPLVLASCPLGGSMSALQALQEHGAGAVVLPSLFAEQIGPAWTDDTERLADYNAGETDYLKYVEDARQILSIPVVASLNGSTLGGWVDAAHRLEIAGADALELNVYDLAQEVHVTGAEVEGRLLDVVSAVRDRVRIPLAVKIGPQFSSLPDLISRLDARGADGVVLFNRFLQPDLDLDTLELRPSIVLSSPGDIRLPLAWIAVLRDQTPMSLAASGGASSAADVLKLLAVGADVVQVASAFLRHGPDLARTLLDGVRTWLEAHGHRSVDAIRGIRSRDYSTHPETYGRIDYTRVAARVDRETVAPAAESPP